MPFAQPPKMQKEKRYLKEEEGSYKYGNQVISNQIFSDVYLPIIIIIIIIIIAIIHWTKNIYFRVIHWTRPSTGHLQTQ